MVVHRIILNPHTFQKLTKCDVLSCVMNEFDTSLLFQVTRPARYHTLMQLRQIVMYLCVSVKLNAEIINVDIIDVDHFHFLVRVEMM